MKSLQEDNRDISLIRGWLEKGEKPGPTDISRESYVVKTIVSQWKRLEIHEGLVVRKYEVHDADIINWQAIVPQTQRRLVLMLSHDVPSSGHLGITKTLSKVRENYFWPGLELDVKIYVTGCDTCQKAKEPIPTKRAPMQVARSGYPMERIAVDMDEVPVTG